MLSSNDIKDIKQMIKSGINYTIIQQKYPISKTFISNINAGKYFFDENEYYPLFKYRISKEIY